MKETEDLTQNDIEGLKIRINTIMGYLKQQNPLRFNNQTTSSESLKINRSNLSAALNGDPRYLNANSQVVDAIFKEFPEINKIWFRTGKGEMIQPVKERSEKPSLNRNLIDIIQKEESVFKALPIGDQLTLIYASIKEMNENIESKIYDQNLKMLKFFDYFEQYLTPMFEFMKNTDEKNKKG